MAIILDIETVAIPDASAYVEPAEPAKNLKDPEKIAADIAKKEADQIDRAALYPWTARIIALGWCYDSDEAVQVRTMNNEAEEAEMLREFWGRVSEHRAYIPYTPGRDIPQVTRVDGRVIEALVTFNGLAFDLPVLASRSTLLGVKAPVLNLDRYRSPHPDLMQLLTYRGAIAARSLTWFAKRFGLNTDGAFSGKEIAGLVEDGNWDAIRSHCVSDVTITRLLAKRLGVIR